VTTPDEKAAPAPKLVLPTWFFFLLALGAYLAAATIVYALAESHGLNPGSFWAAMPLLIVPILGAGLIGSAIVSPFAFLIARRRGARFARVFAWTLLAMLPVATLFLYGVIAMFHGMADM